jgi:predicted secreted hydrolase
MPPSASRRRHLQWLAAQLALASSSAPLAALAMPAQTLAFPRDFGAHPRWRTEWWYITGHAQDEGGRLLGFQLTFFRTRVDVAQALQSRFAARQLIFAHVAVSDVAAGRLWHDQAIAREGFGLAQAATHDTDLRLGRWHLRREGPAQASDYHASLPASGLGLALRFENTQPVLLQGDRGFSRKGPQLSQASHYYSQPQLNARGRIELQGQGRAVQGRAWLDHEWSEELLHPQARGWDWIGINLDDGSALTAFVLRRADGSALWAGGSYRSPGSPSRNFAPQEVRMQAQRHWLSPASQARYPVQWQIDTPAGRHTVRALFDAQELDSRQSTGAFYWEGLSELLDTQGRRVGLGYLEMTGYAAPLRLG